MWQTNGYPHQKTRRQRMTIAASTIQRLLKEQRNACWNCGRPLKDWHVHHAVYGREKKFSKWLDMAENLFLVCRECHSRHGYLSCYFARCCAWTDKVNMGYDMEGWEKSIPMLIHDNFIYLKRVNKNDKG